MAGIFRAQIADGARMLQRLCLVRNGSSNAIISVAFYDAGGCEILVNSAPQTTISVTSTARSLARHLVDAGLLTDQAFPGIPDGAASARFTVLSGAVNANYGGLQSGHNGTNNGVRTNAAPSPSSPWLWTAGSQFAAGARLHE